MIWRMIENTMLKHSLLGYLASIAVDLKKNHEAFAIPPLDPTSSKLFLVSFPQSLVEQDPLIYHLCCEKPTYLSRVRLLSVAKCQ